MRTSRTTARRLTGAVAALGLGLVATGLTLVGPASAAAPAATEKIASGSLNWGFKESFRAYIEGPIAGGGIEVTEPAVRLDDGTFRWARGGGKLDPEAVTATARFKGEVYFYGHDTGSGPALEVWLDKPQLVIDGDTGTILVDLTSRSLSTGEIVEYDDLALADVDVTGIDLDPNAKGVVKLNGLPSTLTQEGSDALEGFYPAGTELDPVGAKLKLAE